MPLGKTVTSGVKKAAQLSPKSFPDTISGSGVPGKGDGHSVFVHLSRGTIGTKARRQGHRSAHQIQTSDFGNKNILGEDTVFLSFVHKVKPC